MRALFQYLFGMRGKKAAPDCVSYRCSDSQAALLFVHGFTGRALGTWTSFIEVLLGDPRLGGWDVFSIGYPTSLRLDVVGVWDADPDLDVCALGLRTRLSLKPLSEYRAVALVAHSMGGLVVQKAITDDPELSKRLSHVFLFATPSDGLLKASWGRVLKRQIRDMANDSAFIRELRQAWRTKFHAGTPFVFRSIAGDRDEFAPPSSTLLPFPDTVQAVVPGNHLEIVRPDGAAHLGFRIVADSLEGRQKSPGVIDTGKLAVELGEFRRAVETLLPRAEELDDAGLVALALALEETGKKSEALALLERRYRNGISSLDALGVLGGRLKRRWLNERVKKDWTDARALYEEGFRQAEIADNHPQAYYHAINISFLDLMGAAVDDPIPAAASVMARNALEHCTKSAETAWRLATEGEAMLVLGDLDAAASLYGRAIRAMQSPREISSAYSQAIQVSTRLFGEGGAKRIEAVFGFIP